MKTAYVHMKSKVCYPAVSRIVVLGALLLPAFGCTKNTADFFGESYSGGTVGTTTILTPSGNITVNYQTLSVNGKTYAVTEGDIILGELQNLQVMENVDTLDEFIAKKNVMNESGEYSEPVTGIQLFPMDAKWPSGDIPYEFDAMLKINPLDRPKLLDAIDYIETLSQGAVRFVPRNPSLAEHHDYISFENWAGFNLREGIVKACKSHYGRKGGKQIITLSFLGCSKKEMVHELLHTLGLRHEHTRADRDEYIQINTQNLPNAPGIIAQFDKLPPELGENLGPYDYLSIMQWDQYRYSANGQPTLTALQYPELNQNQMGNIDPNNPHMSLQDSASLMALYGDTTYGTFYLYRVQPSASLQDYALHTYNVPNIAFWQNQGQEMFQAQLGREYSSDQAIFAYLLATETCVDIMYYPTNAPLYFGYQSLGIAFFASPYKTALNEVPVYEYFNSTNCDHILSTELNDTTFTSQGYSKIVQKPSATNPEEKYTIFYVHAGPSI